MGEDAVIVPKKRYTGYSTVSPKDMIRYIREKTRVKLTMLEKDKFKHKGHEQAWDTIKSITIYWKHLDDHDTKLANRGISTSKQEKVVMTTARMWECDFFTNEKMLG